MEFLDIISGNGLKLNEFSLSKGKSDGLVRLDLVRCFIKGLNVLVVFVKWDAFFTHLEIPETDEQLIFSQSHVILLLESV